MNNCVCYGKAEPWRRTSRVGRRKFLKLSAIGAGLALYRSPAKAGGTAEALLLSCMDYRLVDDLTRFMDGRELTNKYDHVVLAGASAGAISEQFKDWHATFWSHLKVAIDLHHIHKVMIVDHRDCGAYKIAFGAEHAADPDIESAIHGAVLAKLARKIKAEHPKLVVETYLMSLDGGVVSIDATGVCQPIQITDTETRKDESSGHDEGHGGNMAANEAAGKLDGGSLFPEN